MEAIRNDGVKATLYVLRNPAAVKRFVGDVVRMAREADPAPGS
jgi:hypothetical protein